MRETVLQLDAHRRIVANEIARDQQQVEKVEPPRATLQVFVDADNRPQFVAKQRGKIGTRVGAKLFQSRAQLGAPAKNILAGHVAEAAAISLPFPAPTCA